MTRVNLQPSETLCDKHLMAELREMKRIPNSILSGKLRPGAITDKFVLGTGHVKFFSDKLKWLYNRYTDVFNECVDRGVNVNWMWPSHGWLYFSTCKLWNDWEPSTEELELSMSRVLERMPKNAKWTKGC